MRQFESILEQVLEQQQQHQFRDRRNMPRTTTTLTTTWTEDTINNLHLTERLNDINLIFIKILKQKLR